MGVFPPFVSGSLPSISFCLHLRPLIRYVVPALPFLQLPLWGDGDKKQSETSNTYKESAYIVERCSLL